MRTLALVERLMPWRLVGALIALGLIVSASALAQNAACLWQPYEYGAAGAIGWHGSKQDACQAIVDFYTASYTGRTYAAPTVVNTTPGVPSACNGTYMDGAQGPFNYSFGGMSVRSTQVCPPRPGCDQQAPEVGKTMAWGAAMSTGGDYCHSVANCLVRVKQSVGAGGSVVYTGTVTTEDCPTDPAPPMLQEADIEEGEACVAVGDGSYCASPNAGDGSCGYYNDNFVCLAKVRPDECKVFGDSSRVCGASAGTPPAPDGGVAGQPATPDGQVQNTVNNTTTTYNYFNSTTVAASSRPPGSTGEAAGRAGGSPGAEELPEEGGTASGGIGCEAAPVCTGDAIACNALYQAWRARCPGSSSDQEISDALGPPGDLSASTTEVDMENAITTGRFGGTSALACPQPPTINLPAPFNFSFTFDIITWLCLFAGRISGILMAIAYITAARIVGGAL